MKQKPGWVLPDLKEAQKRTTNTIDRIDTFTIPEVARMILPLNTMVTFSWTGSLIAMLRVVKQRQDSHAQLAAQEFAAKLKTILQQHFPEATKAYMNYL